MTACLDTDEIPAAEQSQAEVLQQIRKQKSEIINCRISELKDKLTHDGFLRTGACLEERILQLAERPADKAIRLQRDKTEFRDGLCCGCNCFPIMKSMLYAALGLIDGFN